MNIHDSDPFQQWVATTVQWLLHELYQPSPRKCALTYVESRMDACQGVLGEYFLDEFPDSMRLSKEVDANLAFPLEKRRLH